MLPIAAAIAYTIPELKPVANDFIARLVPISLKLHVGSVIVICASLFSLLRLAVGLGIWFLERWARTIIILDLSWAFCRAAVGLAISISFDHKLPPLPSSPLYLAMDIVISGFILVYLFDPDVRRAFGIRE
jgi:TRAP-type C4-dicarboxylate transport system permease small subunit